MTHIATHPPSAEGSYISASPLYQMLGYLYLANNETGGYDDNFKILFVNNSGYQFKKGKNNPYGDNPIGCHLALFKLSDELKKKLNDTKSYCAIAYDLVDYNLHKQAEAELMGPTGGKIEDARIEFIQARIDAGLSGPADEKAMKNAILEQTTRYMRTETFKITYPHYKKGINSWIRKNVATLDETESTILGCSDFTKGNKKIMNDFQAFLAAKPGVVAQS